MPTNLDLDDALIVKAVALGGHPSKRAAVTQALTEYVQHLEQAQIISMFGTIDYDSTYDDKLQRQRK